MRITGVECVCVGWHLDQEIRWGTMAVGTKGSTLIFVHTDEGVTGIGEAGFSAAFYPSVRAVVDSVLRDAVMGEDPLEIGALWQKMYRRTHMWGRRGMETYALSGIDIALWDILGKSLGTPIHRMLGTVQTRLRAYAAPSLKPPHEAITDAEAAAAVGFAGVKLRGGICAKDDIQTVVGARRAVGDAIYLMLDPNVGYDLETAIALAPHFRDAQLYWLEEPIHTQSLPQYVDLHRELSRATGLRLAGGESLFTPSEFVDLVTQRPFAVLQPDCTAVGGITATVKIAGMAEAAGLLCIPHIACSSGTGVSLAVAAQVIASLPNCPWIEYDAYEDPPGGHLIGDVFRLHDGYVQVPDGPGLGVELDMNAVRRLAQG